MRRSLWLSALLPGPRPAPSPAFHPALLGSPPCPTLPTTTHPLPALLAQPPRPSAPPSMPPDPAPLAHWPSLRGPRPRPPCSSVPPPWPSAPPSLTSAPPPRPSAPPGLAFGPASSVPTTPPRPRPPHPRAASQAGSHLRPSSRPCAGLRVPLGPALPPPPFLLCASAHRPPSRARPACALPARLSAGSVLRAPPCGRASSAPARRSTSSAAARRGRFSRRLSPAGPGLRRGPCTGTARTGCEHSKYNFPGPRPPRPRCHPRALAPPPESWPCPGSPPSRCPWRETLEATFVDEGNARPALSLSRWKSDARPEGELPLWKRKSGGW